MRSLSLHWCWESMTRIVNLLFCKKVSVEWKLRVRYQIFDWNIDHSYKSSINSYKSINNEKYNEYMNVLTTNLEFLWYLVHICKTLNINKEVRILGFYLIKIDSKITTKQVIIKHSRSLNIWNNKLDASQDIIFSSEYGLEMILVS